jgi:hypothetical protein
MGLFMGAVGGLIVTVAVAVLVIAAGSIRDFFRRATNGYWLVEVQVLITHKKEEGRSSPHQMVIRAPSAREAERIAERTVPASVEREALPPSLEGEWVSSIAQTPYVSVHYRARNSRVE